MAAVLETTQQQLVQVQEELDEHKQKLERATITSTYRDAATLVREREVEEASREQRAAFRDAVLAARKSQEQPSTQWAGYEAVSESPPARHRSESVARYAATPPVRDAVADAFGAAQKVCHAVN